MSFTNSPPVFVPSNHSNHSLYTPSYSVDGLVPIQCPDLDLEPSLPITRFQPASNSTKSSNISSSPSSKEPIQYQKLKMSYLRRLNVIPIVSQKDVLTVLGKEQLTKAPSSKKSTKKLKSLGKASKAKTLREDSSDSNFMPSFFAFE